MRMRKKKHLDERLEGCGGYIFDLVCEDRNFVTAIEKKEYIDLEGLFGRRAPTVLEIGCGKGGFATELARREPEVNVLALEKAANVIVMAAEKAKEKALPNVRFLHGGAEYLRKFIEPHSISRIYLNFSCPYPKNAYANRRLTAPFFLESYKSILADGAEIIQKTDNMHFFEYSIEQFSACGYKIKDVTLDLHASGDEDNIVTEYEKRFTDLGQPIYRLTAYLDGVKADV